MRLRVLSLLLIFPGGAFGQDPPPRSGRAPSELAATAQFAPGGELVGPWQGYVVDLDSRATRDLDLLVRIEDDSFAAVAIRREHLSPGGRKRVFLYAPGSAFPRSLPARYRVTDASGRELAAGLIPTTPRSYVANSYQIAIFSRLPSTEEDFGIPTNLNGWEVHFGRLSAETFPDRWIGLSGIDLIVLHDSPLDELSTDQARALSDYVRHGGSVLLSPGPTKGWLTHPALASFAPLRSEPPKEVTELRGLNQAYGPFRRADPFLVHPLIGGEPLTPLIGRDLVRLSSGFGRVFAVGVDLRHAPFDTWTGRRAMWTEIVTACPHANQEDRTAFPCAASPRQRFELFQQMARLVNPYPSFGLILGLATLFLAAVGPLNYFLLWRVRKTLLLVVTIPAISIGFLAFILILGYVLKGTSTVVHSARLLFTRSGVDCARETHLFSVFSPATRTYDVAAEPGSFLEPPGRWSATEDRVYSRQESPSTLTCETGAGLTLRGLGTGQWQSWDLEGRALAELGKGVRFEATDAAVRVLNDSPRTIERAIFVQTGREPCVVPLGLIAPGGRADAAVVPSLTDPLAALGFGPDTLGDRLLRPWISSVVRPLRVGDAPPDATRRFLLCVLREDRVPVTLDARISSRSSSLTLLHVAEGP